MTPPAPEISWDDAVAEGKRLVAEGKRLDTEGKRLAVAVDKNDWRLAELADQVVKKYGQNKLGQFTSEIGWHTVLLNAAGRPTGNGKRP